jgi:hypothetical protein
MAEIIVIRTIHITLVAPAIPILAVFIVAVRSQEVAPLSESGVTGFDFTLKKRMSGRALHWVRARSGKAVGKENTVTQSMFGCGPSRPCLKNSFPQCRRKRTNPNAPNDPARSWTQA